MTSAPSLVDSMRDLHSLTQESGIFSSVIPLNCWTSFLTSHQVMAPLDSERTEKLQRYLSQVKQYSATIMDICDDSDADLTGSPSAPPRVLF